MAMSFIGKPISLISHSDVRYRGILAGIDPVNSTIQLQNVYSMGTEDRRPAAEYIPPADLPYQYIIFRASEVKDLAVDHTVDPPRRNLHDDPAIIGASQSPLPNNPYTQYPAQQYPSPVPPPQGQLPPRQQPSASPRVGNRPPPPRAQETSAAPPIANVNANGQSNEQRNGSVPNTPGATLRSNSKSVSTAVASLETVERALGDLRIANAAASNTNGANRNGNGRRGRQDAKANEIKVPTTDFDFESSNARFDKASVAIDKEKLEGNTNEEDKVTPDDDENKSESRSTPVKEKEGDKAYNPKRSFFDTLSSSANSAPPAGRGTGRRGQGRNRREEERERNVATFGEPGGVGLMGPGAYVHGWGGFGRRGGGRGRRGGNPSAPRH